MKIYTILTALAVLAVALTHPAQAEFTRHGGQARTKGEVTHLNGVALPPIQTAAQARAETEKRLAAIRAAEAKVAAQASVHPPSAISNPQFFYTGKPYLEESGQYVFLFRHYDPELGRWTTADPSGFPDGANNVAYMAVPTTEFDWQGLKSVAWVVAWTSLVTPEIMNTSYNQFQSSFHLVRQGFVDEDTATRGTQNPTHLLDDGDSFDFFSVGDAFDFASSSISSYDRIY